MMQIEIELIPTPPLPIKNDIVHSICMTYHTGQFFQIKNNQTVALKDGDFIHTVEVSYRVIIRTYGPHLTQTSSNEIFADTEIETTHPALYAELGALFTPKTKENNASLLQSILPTENRKDDNPLDFLKKSLALTTSFFQKHEKSS